MYVTMEPCPMCASAIKQSRIGNVYSACNNSFINNEKILTIKIQDNEEIYSHLKNMEPFTQSEFNLLNDYFLEYAVLGGMPAVVKQFLIDGNYSNILAIQTQLVNDYEEDITKYAEGLDKTKIKNIYRNIPMFLAQENKKFQITKVAKNARNRDYVGCADWLKDAGVVYFCYCLNSASLPLKGNYDEFKYKIYYHDNGLLIANLDEESAEDLRKNRNLGTYKGAIYENLVGQMLKNAGFDLYYYKKEMAGINLFQTLFYCIISCIKY